MNYKSFGLVDYKEESYALVQYNDGDYYRFGLYLFIEDSLFRSPVTVWSIKKDKEYSSGSMFMVALLSIAREQVDIYGLRDGAYTVDEYEAMLGEPKKRIEGVD